jgi:hypothetical protein
MIGVQIDNTFAELNEDTTISVELFNPIFNDGDVIKGSSTMPFNMPGAEKSEVNSRLFKNPDVIGNIESFKSVDSKLFYAGVPWRSGKLKATGYDKSVIQANYIFGISTIADNIKTAKLRDIITGQSNTFDSLTLNKGFYIKNNVAFPLKLKINGREISASSLINLHGLINQTENETKVSAILGVSGDTPGGATLPWLLVSVNPLLGGDPHDPTWPISVEPIEDTEAEKAKWYIEPVGMSAYGDAIRDFVESNSLMCFPTRFNPGLYGDAPNPKPNDIVNGKNSSGFLLNTIDNGSFLVNNRNSIHPFLKVKFVLDQIASEFDIEFEGDWYDDPDTDKMLLDNSACLDVSLPFIGTKNYIFCKRTFNLSDLVPDITVQGFLKSFQNRYNLAIYQNEKNGKIVMQKREPIAKANTYTEITSKSGPTAPIDDQRLTGTRLVAVIDSEDALAVTDEHTVGEPEPDGEIKSEISGISSEFTIGQLDGEDGIVTGPYVSKKQNSKTPFRIFYYLGDVDNGTFVYQGASINATGYDEKFSGINGLYEKNYKAWLKKRMDRQVINLDVDFPFRTLREIPWAVKHRYDRSNFLIYSISVQLTMKRVMISKVKLYTF